MTHTDLFSPLELGPLVLPNRIVMAPMTRSRAGPGNVPTALGAEYYVQRASAGLIVTEATQVSPQGVGYPATPGIHSDAQVEGWRRVTGAVHETGGRIFLQLWHVGRISHPSLQPGGALPVAPSAIAAEGEVFTASGPQPFVVPRALETRRSRASSPSSRTAPAVPSRPGSTASRSTAPTAISPTSSCGTARIAAPIAMAGAWKTAPASCSR